MKKKVIFFCGRSVEHEVSLRSAKKWEATGLAYKELISQLLQLGRQKHDEEKLLKRDFI